MKLQAQQQLLPELNELVWSIQEEVYRANKEFPVTAMSSAVAKHLWSLEPRSPDEDFALDVGTGSGLHSFIMRLRGFRVYGIDVNPVAVECARNRVEQWLPRYLLDGHREVAFGSCGIDDFNRDAIYSVIAFNPPAFFPVFSTRTTPIGYGVYVDGDFNNYSDCEASLLYRFFKKIVLPWLAPGGRVICSWPGLEKRVVELDGEIVHPANLLQYWFGMNIEAEKASSFYSEALQVGDYGLGDGFWEDMYVGSYRGLYSRLLNLHDETNNFGQSFRFGILQLRRDLLDPMRFYLEKIDE